MSPDFMTVLWKEWKEIMLQRSAGGGGARQPLIMILIIGVLLPFRMPPERFFSLLQLTVLAIVSAAAISVVVADAFAGERERHTLETLLASRLPDSAILFGKIAACVAYGWFISLACVVIGTVTANARNWNGHVRFYHDTASWIALLVGPPLVGAAVSAAGVFVSLHAATVRQAQQTLGVGLMILIFGVIFGIDALPESWKTWFLKILFGWSAMELALVAAGIAALIDVALIAAAMARFQRSKLILD